jgi:hypothetical protein
LKSLSEAGPGEYIKTPTGHGSGGYSTPTDHESYEKFKKEMVFAHSMVKMMIARQRRKCNKVSRQKTKK